MKPTVSVAFQIIPKTNSHEETIRLIDSAIAVVKESGVSYEVGPMETVMEGESLDVMIAIVKQAHDACLAGGAERVFINMKVLSNPRGIMSIQEKTAKHR
jgi:uncharacterized protein YqgV (UPF0045/DUF77 family)